MPREVVPPTQNKHPRSLNLPKWGLNDITLRLDSFEHHPAAPPLALADFPALLKAAQDKMAAIEAEERRQDEEQQLAWEAHVAMEKADHQRGVHAQDAEQL